jgi:hypothetical protein
MSLLISNKVGYVRLNAYLVDDEDYLDALLDEDQILPAGALVYVDTGADKYVIVGNGTPISEAPVMGEGGGVSIPDVPALGEYVLTSIDGEVSWEEVTE